MRFRLRHLPYIISLLITIGFIVWLFIRPTILELAKTNLSEARSYGEIKGVWQDYEEDLGENSEWKEVVEQKLSATTLNDKQKQDLLTWLPEKEPVASFTAAKKAVEKPEEVKTESKKAEVKKTEVEKPVIKSPAEDQISSIEESNKNLSKKDLAELYNKQGDEKCSAFKAANAPHLYHIANEYYEYAASLTNSEPRVCE
jgi:hypothetical protein